MHKTIENTSLIKVTETLGLLALLAYGVSGKCCEHRPVYMHDLVTPVPPLDFQVFQRQGHRQVH